MSGGKACALRNGSLLVWVEVWAQAHSHSPLLSSQWKVSRNYCENVLSVSLQTTHQSSKTFTFGVSRALGELVGFQIFTSSSFSFLWGVSQGNNHMMFVYTTITIYMMLYPWLLYHHSSECLPWRALLALETFSCVYALLALLNHTGMGWLLWTLHQFNFRQ